jgi:hypothetical protein
MTDLEGSLIKVARTRPQTIGGRPVARAINTMTPHAFGEVYPLSGFNHLGGRRRRELSLLEAFRNPALGKERSIGTARYQDDSEGSCGNDPGLPSYAVHHVHPHRVNPG